jgi:hypothetical protein
MRLLTREGYLIEEQGMTYLAEPDSVPALTPLQAVSCTYRNKSLIDTPSCGNMQMSTLALRRKCSGIPSIARPMLARQRRVPAV